MVSGLVSTWMGGRLGIPGAAGLKEKKTPFASAEGTEIEYVWGKAGAHRVWEPESLQRKEGTRSTNLT